MNSLCILQKLFFIEMNIYTIKTKKQQSPGTMTIMGAKDTKKVITKCKN